MSHEEQAPSLARWLDSPPGTAPPDDLDDEVVESIYALRPDLAPAPRLTADDILASVTRGPLAGAPADAPAVAGDGGGEVVPFPARHAPAPEVAEAEPQVRSRWPSWARNTGGLGLALVAAATLIVVAMPQLERSAEPTASPAAAEVAKQEAGPPSSSVAASAPADEVAAAPAAEPPAPLASARARNQTADSSVARQAAGGEALDMKPMAPIRASETIPELAEVDAVADAELDDRRGESSIDLAPAAAAPPADLDENARRAPASWRDGVDADTLARIDRAIEKANGQRAKGKYRDAGDTLASHVQPPPRAGMYVAALAAQDYLRAGMPDQAAGVAQRGLGLSSEPLPERAQLELIYADAQSALHPRAAPALDAYDEATEQSGDAR